MKLLRGLIFWVLGVGFVLWRAETAMSASVFSTTSATSVATSTSTTTPESFYGFSVLDAQEKSVSLSQYKNHVVLVVNVASKCGFTKQYDGLEKLYATYQSKGFVILGFPSNQFMGQEPGSNEEIQQFCRLTYGVNFPVLAKVNVKGPEAIPLYKWLTSQKGFDGPITWNFNKFLLNRKGVVVKRYPSATKPEEIEDDIKKLL